VLPSIPIELALNWKKIRIWDFKRRRIKKLLSGTSIGIILK